MKLRGDRRSDIRKKDRRSSARTPGKFKHVLDIVFETERKHGKEKSRGTRKRIKAETGNDPSQKRLEDRTGKSQKTKIVKVDKRPEWLKKSHGPKCDCMCCHDYKPEINKPIWTGDYYECPLCKARGIKTKFVSSQAIKLHLGKVPNLPANYPGFCPFL